MSTQLDNGWMNFKFRLISFADLDYHLFLRSARLEEVVLGVLADFRDDSPERALQQIVQRVQETTVGDFPLKRYFKQLGVLAQLRKLEKKLKDITMDSISKFVSQKRDVAYLVGFDKGEEEAKTRFVKNLLVKMSLTVEQIADIAGVSIDFVKNVQQDNKQG